MHFIYLENAFLNLVWAMEEHYQMKMDNFGATTRHMDELWYKLCHKLWHQHYSTKIPETPCFFFFLRDNSTYMVESSLGFTQKKKKNYL